MTKGLDEAALDAAALQLRRFYVLHGSLHGKPLPIADWLYREIASTAVTAYQEAVEGGEPQQDGARDDEAARRDLARYGTLL